MSTEAHPARIGRYEIQKPLGSGAMGDVFLAKDPNIGRLVAIKTVRVIGGNEEDIADRRKRLLLEARAAGKFVHPNVVALYDAGEADGLLYLAFEYVPGMDLLKRARQSPEMSLREVLRVVRETASALDYAQSENVVHRDIKPSNILLGPRGVAKVADFGIAKLTDQSVELTRTGSVVGSPQYMSPEQIRGEELDGRSDIFSLGVVFYELLSRTRPFGGDTISTLVFEILAKEPMPIESLRPGLPPSLIQLVRSMMVKDRQQRVADAGKVVDAIQALEREIPAADLDRPASQAPNPDAQPTQLMGSAPVSAGIAAATSPYPSGPQTPLPFASSNPTGVPLTGVPMGAPLPSGPLTALPPSAFAPSSGAQQQGSQGYGQAPSYGAPTAPPTAPGWNAPPPPPSWNAPPPPPSMTPPAMTQPPQGYPPPAGYPPQGGYPPGQQHQQHQQYQQHQQHQQAYGQPPRQQYPTAKPTSPLKLILLLVFFGGFGLVGAFVLYLLFGDSSDPAKPATPTTPTVQEAPPPPDATETEKTYGSGEVVIGQHETPDEDAPAEATDGTAPTWTEPQPTPVTTPTPTPAPVDPVPTQTRPRTPTSQGDGGALGRLGDAIRTGDGAESGAGDETEADGGEADGGGDYEPAPRRPRQEAPEIAAWDQKAAGAKSEMDTGLRFQFKVSPPEAKVLFWVRGDERAVVQGSAGDFDPKKDEEARVLELPGDGDYLLMLRHGDFPDYVIKVNADRSRGKQPKVLQLNLGRGGGTTGTVRVSKAISFAGTPGDAYVFVNGRPLGKASDYPGGEKRSAENLKLDRGKHVVRLEAPGYKPYEFRVEVAGGAPAVEQVNFRLEKE